MTTVQASVPVLEWAVLKSGIEINKVEQKFHGWKSWISGESRPTLKQLEDFSKLTHTPFGYFFLDEPPKRKLPIPDFRTVGDAEITEVSDNLMDTIFLCEQRQNWYLNYAKKNLYEDLDFVGKFSIENTISEVAESIREIIKFDLNSREKSSSWEKSFSEMISGIESSGIMVMVSSIVGSNTHRHLNVEEFRGFVLVDKTAPLIFINAADSKSAQMFTLAHELAHIWIGKSGVSDPRINNELEGRVEKWCNSVATELLVPKSNFIKIFDNSAELETEVPRLSKIFKVSPLVIIRRLYECNFIDYKLLNSFYEKQLSIIEKIKNEGSGGSYYNTKPIQTSKIFLKSILIDTLEGNTLYTEAFRLIGTNKTSTIEKLAQKLL